MPDLQDLSERRAKLSPEQLAKLRTRLRGGAAAATAQHAIPRRPPCDQAPLSFAQQRQWFLWKLDPTSAAYHLSGGLMFVGRLDVPALHASIEALVARHASLRTVFREGSDGLAEQFIQPTPDIELSCIDLAGLEAGARESRLQDEVQRICATPFDLAHGPLLRAALLRTGENEHRLVVVMHHIVSDGWSTQLILDELAALYRARLQGQPAGLPELPIQYADYAVWQRQWLGGAEGERQLAWWREQLGDEQPFLGLHTDRPRRVDGQYAAALHGVVLAGDLSERLRQRAQSHGSTLFMALLAAFQVVLFRHSGQTDIRVGVPIANRNRAEAAGLVGFFVNTQVLRARLDGRMTLAELLGQTRDGALGAQAHQDLPFERLVEALQPERSLGTNPLFQVMFNHLRQDHRSLVQWPGVAVQRLDFDEQAAQFELTLETCESEDGKVKARFRYARELFEPQTIERLADHYLAVLQALAERPEQPLGDMELLSEAERTQLRQWGENPQRYPDAEPLHRLFERQARERPQATALVFGDEELSYSELNRRANRLAHWLIAFGVAPETRVGIFVERSVEMVVGLLAILKAGGAYVPLDPDYPNERFAYMVEDSGIALLLTQSHLTGRIPSQAPATLELDRLDLDGAPEHDPRVELHGDNLAYVIYTSGSTGQPKGAANRHRSLHNRLAWMQEAYRLGESDSVLQKTPFGFDVSVWEFFWPLMTGARLVVANPGDHRDPGRLVELIRRHGVTTLHFVPSMLQAFLAYEGIEACSSLSRILCSGEALPAEARNGVFRRLSQAALHNLYGPTEAAIDVTHWTCRDDGQSQVPIGRPISGIQTHVLDADLNPVPPGVAGELYLGGIGLGRGYLNRAGLTAERFVADPSGTGERLYRTGDLVRWNAEGQLEYLGRLDHQVKIRGLRIELGEVEAQLLAQPAVREAVVVAQEGPGGARLVGYVAGQGLDGGVLRERLGRVLPDYMVPGALVVLEALPLNANGKVDRKALPEPELVSERAYEAPQGEIEERLAEIWAEVLGVERVGRQDSFFELGGHSLLALRLLERIRGQGWAVQVRTLFEHPRLAAFAQAVMQGGERREVVVPPNGIPAGCEAIRPEMLTLIGLSAEQIGRIEAAVPGGAANIQDIYPLAPLQEGILFHHLLQAKSDAYITRCLLSFDSEERLKCFIDSLNQVIARHDILRTAVLWEGLKEPLQVVYRQAPLQLEWLEKDSEAEAGNAADRLNAHVHPSHYRIDVRQAPMIRAVAMHDVAQGRWLLQLPCHHLVLDHTTLELMVEEIALIQQGHQDKLLEPVPFRSFVAQARLGVSQAEHEAFFSKLLGDVEEPTAPFGLLDVQGDGSEVEEARLPLATELSSQVRLQAQRYGVSAATLFHLAWALVLARTTGKDDVVFGTVLFGRMQGGESAERALGLFINTLPLRIRMGARNVERCLRETHAALAGLLHHEHASLSLVQRCSALPGGTPLFSALLNYRYGSQQSGAGVASAWEGMDVLGGEERTNYPLMLSVDDLGEDFELVVQVTRSVGAQRLCGYMQAAVEGLVKALIERPGQLACEVEVMSEQERRQLRQWSENPRHYSDAEPAHWLFERQARERPQATALVFGDEELSYSELNRRANRLAHRLIALGVGPETPVGIAVERSVEMVVGLLAILKAGGAYVPLDPEYPAERLAWMVEDSGIGLLLTQSHVRGRVSGSQALTTLELDSLDLGGEPEHDPRVVLCGDNLAYVIFTSGSTGRPKSTAMPHRVVSQLMAWQLARLPGSYRTMLFASPCFDVSFQEIVSGLGSGGTLVQTRDDERHDFSLLLELVSRQSVERLFLPFAVLQLFAESALTSGIKLPRLRQVITAGEQLKLTRPLVEWLETEGQCQLINQYGPTESHVVSDFLVEKAYRMELPPIGAPASNAHLRVMDSHLQLVPPGVPGELYIGSTVLARGYLNRSGLTAERFVADPFDPEGGRLYRTGDLVCWNTDGQLEYLGRIDHQVKIRGFRIELGEIEAQLLAQPEVREAVVVAKEGPGGARLVGYVAGQGVDGGALCERLGRVLPDYMVPGALVVLEALPLNANGKVDRKALPEPEPADERAYEPPQGEVEEALAAIWAEVLGVERVGRHDNFFELGGHSLLAIRITALLAQRHACELAVRHFFDAPTIRALAAHLPAGGLPAQGSRAQRLSEIDSLLSEFEV